MQCAVAMPYAVRNADPVERGGPRGSLVSPSFGYGEIHVWGRPLLTLFFETLEKQSCK